MGRKIFGYYLYYYCVNGNDRQVKQNIGGFMSADPNGCHTIEQTIIRALIGIVYGVIFSKDISKILKI